MEERVLGHRRRIVAGAWVAAIATAAALGLAESSLARGTDADSLSSRLAERAIGPDARRTEDGLYRVRAGNAELLTHGPDPAPPAHRLATRVAGGVFGPNGAERPPVCASDYYQHILVGYVVGTANPVDAVRSEVQSAIRRMNWVMNADAVASGGTTADYKVLCDAQAQIQVDSFASPSPAFQDVVAAARSAGFANPRADYTIFFDAGGPGGGCGIGSYRSDERLTESNASNTGGGYGIVYEPCWSGTTPMHENAHNQGAVQYSAPQATGTGGHCNQGYDALCYTPDGGDRNQTALNVVCSDRPHFDCGGDDYFDTAPEPGEYLESHWNLGSPLNRFIAFGGNPPVTESPPATAEIARIQIGDSVSGLVGAAPALYQLTVPPGRRTMDIRGAGASGIRLYLRRGAAPDGSSWQYRSQEGPSPRLRVNRARAGEWFIGVADAGAQGAEFSLRVRIR